MTDNLWILTEERPKRKVLQTIFEIFASEYKCEFFTDTLRIVPILNSDRVFEFTYRVIGFTCTIVNNVYIKIVSGSSSFTDFLIFYQDAEPEQCHTPIFAIEETKTDDSESRNTGVYQRCSKFVYLREFYPGVKMIMLYNLKVEQKQMPTKTNIFGTKLLRTFGVEIYGKTGYDSDLFSPFESIDDIISYKANMRHAPQGNVPISIVKRNDDKIEVSGRLYKDNGLNHDPNIGALSIICAVLRLLGWQGVIEIKHHGLSQQHLNGRNKFVRIASMLGLSLQGLTLPAAIQAKEYWHYDRSGEKLATILIHIAVENFTSGYSIFENHAGCEKSYFLTPGGECLALKKYRDRTAYKAGDKNAIIHIPDLILLDRDRCEIIDIEGKKFAFRQNGIDELANYDCIETEYIAEHYPEYEIKRTVVVYGGIGNRVCDSEIGFMLNATGNMILGPNAPQIFHEAIDNLKDFWNKRLNR